jgi:hypothetical protein
MTAATGFGLQDAIAALAVLAALAWLVRRAVRKKARATPFCGDCPGCATPSGPQAGVPAPRAGFVPLSEFGGRGSLAGGGRDPRPASR